MTRVLVMDGEHASRAALRTLLEANGFEVQEVDAATAAVAAALRQPPDVLIASVPSDGSDRYALLLRWMTDARLRAIPVVVRTGPDATARDLQLPYNLGAHAVITTPLQSETVLAQLQDLLGRQRVQKRQHSPGPPGERAPSSTAAAAPQASEATLRLVTEASNIGLWDLDLRTNDVYFSPIWKRQIGYEDHEIPNRLEEWHNRVHPDDLERAFELTSTFLAAPEPYFETEFRFRHKDGSYRWILARTALVSDEQGTPIRMLGSHLDITERKRAETALRESEVKFSAAFSSSPVALAIIAPNNEYIEANHAFCKLLGYRRDEIIGRTVRELALVSDEDADRLRAAIERDTGSILDVELRVRTRDGAIRHIISSTTTIPIDGVPHRVSTALDITERKQAEAALRDSEAKFSAAFHSSLVALAINAPDGTYVDVNNAFCELSGYARDEVIGRSVTSMGFLSEDEQTSRREQLSRASGSVSNMELTVRIRDGSTRDVASSVTTFTLNGVNYFLSTSIDITERKRAEERVRQLNRTYAVLSDINQLIVREVEPQVVLDSACRIAVEKGKFLLAWIGTDKLSAGRLQVTAHAGATPDTLSVLGQILSDPDWGCSFTAEAFTTGRYTVCNDIDADAAAIPWRDVALQRGYRAMASFPITVNGRPFGTFNLYAGHQGAFDAEELQLLDELARDISFALEIRGREHQRQQALQELQASEERFRELAETIQDVFWVTDANMQHLYYVSPAFERIWQRSRQSLYEDPESWLYPVHPDDIQRLKQTIEQREPGTPYTAEYRLVHKDGTVRWIHSQAFTVRGPAGTLDRIVGVVRDVTERRTLEQQLAQSQKMQAIGTLAGGIAHDFNNLLAAIIGNAELARLELQDRGATLSSVDEIVRAGQRARELVQRILTFSRPHEQQRKPIALEAVLTEAVRLLRSTLPAGVEVRFECTNDVPAVQADESQIHQIIVNLATNAWHAMMGQSGRIDIKLQACQLDSAFLLSHPELHPGPHVSLSVSDTGRGMEAETIERIFEPFFTTKSAGQGAGLGLSVVHGIVRAHGGAIAVKSQVDAGSTFYIYFPATAEKAEPSAPASTPKPRNRGGGERILYLDDEESLVYLAVRFLERLGYDVEGYTRAEEALAAFRSDPTAFDLIITDYNMPGMSGMEVARELLRINAHVGVVLSSGYVRPAEIEQARALGIAEIFLKPNTIEELGEIVQRLLSKRTT